MFENATVTLSLNDFDTLRNNEAQYRKWYGEIASSLSKCFDYKCTKNPHPPECASCRTATGNQHALPHDRAGTIADDCIKCATFQSHKEYNELITVDVERLIQTTKEFALYRKDIETDLDAIPVERAEGGGTHE